MHDWLPFGEECSRYPSAFLECLHSVPVRTKNASEITDTLPHLPTPLLICEARSRSLPTVTTGGSSSPSLQTTPGLIPIDSVVTPSSDAAHHFSSLKDSRLLSVRLASRRRKLLQDSSNLAFGAPLP